MNELDIVLITFLSNISALFNSSFMWSSDKLLFRYDFLFLFIDDKKIAQLVFVIIVERLLITTHI